MADTTHVARISQEDIAEVRQRVRIETVVGEVVALRAGGPTTLKGLCPFHEEKTPSFQVSPDKGFWYCFGCSQGGDAISFVRRHEGLTFVEAVQKLADLFDVPLTLMEQDEEDASKYARRKAALRALAAAHQHYRKSFANLTDTHPAKIFLSGRGFDAAVCEQFEVGYASGGWHDLETALTPSGVTQEALMDAGLLVTGEKDPYDRFRHRLLWPITDPSGKVIGFGGRKLDPDDNGPKYLNSPETLVYQKSRALYRLDVARRHAAADGRLVIVEGYTDVMAFAAAGVRSAVATCGTAFGAEHVSLLRRSIGDGDAFSGEIIFAFDGDAAGQKAALRAFDLDVRFSRRTFVSVAPDGLDPCDLRARDGNAALQEMLSGRVPLAEYAVAHTIAGRDLSTTEGRLAALDAAAPVLARIRDDALRHSYETWLAGRIGVEAWRVSKHVREVAARPQHDPVAEPAHDAAPAPWVEREALKCALQHPEHVAEWWMSVEESAFTFESHGQLSAALSTILPHLPTSESVGEELSAAGCDPNLVASLMLEPLSYSGPADGLADHCQETLIRLLDADAKRRSEALKAALSSMNPDGPAFVDAYQQLLAVEQYRRSLRAG